MTISIDQYFARRSRVGSVFTPGSPVNERDLFAGRLDQLNRITDALSQRGYHAVLYGERGVGKTSLANILTAVLSPMGYLFAKVNCDAGDTFATIWHKALRDITYTSAKSSIGFNPEQQAVTTSVADLIPASPTPDDIRRVLTNLGQQMPVVIVLDEFDRVADPGVSTLVSDTIKALSDFGAPASILLIGVASSIEQLVHGHLSIERALVQIPMPRMSNSEVGTIFDQGLKRLEMEIDEFARSHMIALAQGLPYIAHLLALHSARAALSSSSLTIDRSHVDMGIRDSLEQWQESSKVAFYHAVKSQQPGAIYREVLLACAMAEVDELGYFSAASVRAPLRRILGRNIDIPNFARHLKELSDEGRGSVLQRTGKLRRIRYRFSSPLMRPYIIMNGYAEGLLH